MSLLPLQRAIMTATKKHNAKEKAMKTITFKKGRVVELTKDVEVSRSIVIRKGTQGDMLKFINSELIQVELHVWTPFNKLLYIVAEVNHSEMKEVA